MNYRRLGNSGLSVSEVSLGSWLTFGSSVDQESCNRIVRFALGRGINLFDTADVYAQGVGERVLGRALADVPRKDYVLASKCYFPTGDGPNDRGLSRKHIFESVHASLERLGTDYLDLYQCHRFDPETPLIQPIRAMDDLIHQGKILYWGISCWTAAEIRETVQICERDGYYPPISNQPPYSMFERSIEVEVEPVCRELGLSQIVFSPLAQGVLSGKYSAGSFPAGTRAADKDRNQFMQRFLSSQHLDAAARLADIARRVDLPLAPFALAWCLRLTGVSSVIVGSTSQEQLEENLMATERELPGAILKEVLEVLQELPVSPE